MKNKKIAISIIIFAILLTLGTAVYAYFATWCLSKGEISIHSKIPQLAVEKRDNKVFVTIKDAPQTTFIRAKVLIPESVKVEKNDTQDWYWKDEYIYYKNPVKPTSKTEIEMPDFPIDDAGAVNKNYNIIVVAEATKAQYDENGNPIANWEFKVNN